jgi:predicted house-cleaning NTP pyrophosphatase (Maf/HAM1 superfamily)
MGAVLVKEIEGDYNNVVGLPVSEVFRRLDGMVHSQSYS